MASDPRLNLLDFSVTINNTLPSAFGVGMHATQCPSVSQRGQLAGIGASLALSATLGPIGLNANLSAGIGGGPVGAGLSTLAAISNQVRLVGPSALPPASVGNGQNYVLNTVGINPGQLTAASQFNPTVVASTQTQATSVYASVSAGTFTTGSIPGAFSALQNGAALVSSLFTPNTNVTQPQGSQFGSQCAVGNPATDLIAFAPKYKFLFVVQFEFDPAFGGVLSKNFGIDPAFVVQTTTRPSVEFEYEDVNMYNFRTKVARKAMYQPITMKFYDDDGNNAFQLYTTYLKLLSPIANLDAEFTKQDPLDVYDQSGGGMGFENAGANGQGNAVISPRWPSVLGRKYAASIGPYGASAAEAGSKSTLPRKRQWSAIFIIFVVLCIFWSPLFKSICSVQLVKCILIICCNLFNNTNNNK